MTVAAQTLEGWYCLHDFRLINWQVWTSYSAEERAEAIEEYIALEQRWRKTEQAREGSTAVYSIVGQKADMMFMHLRETLEELSRSRPSSTKQSWQRR